MEFVFHEWRRSILSRLLSRRSAEQVAYA